MRTLAFALLWALLAGNSVATARVRPDAVAPAPLQPKLISSGTTENISHAAADTFYLYGGPGTQEGKFETGEDLPDPQGWVGFDPSDRPDYWQVSTFNAENLNANGSGNHAIWAGRTAEQEPFWFAAPGSGVGWNETLNWSRAVDDPGAATQVTLEFWYNHDTEPGYDYFHVEWNAAGTWIPLLSVFGSNRNFNTQNFDPPGEHFQQTWTVQPSDYVGDGGDEVQLRLRVITDGAFSDEDGLWPSDGAVQADDIRVAFDGDDVSFADFEPAGQDGGWTPGYRVMGDFSKLLVGLTDLDPCADNRSPQWTFIDDGSPPNNAPGRSTGGSMSALGGYGTPGGWVVNHTGGLRGDSSELENEIWSPAIVWDAPPGTGYRTLVRFDVFGHSCCFQPSYRWRIRTSSDGGSTWAPWSQRSLFLSAPPVDPGYYRRTEDLTDEIPAGTTHIQLSWAYLDPGNWGPSTPAPFLDNVAVLKFASGPRLTIAADNLLQGGFPHAGGLDVSSMMSRDALDVRLDRSSGFSPDIDFVQVTVEPLDESETQPASSVLIVWILEKNPLFEEGIRTMPAGSTTLAEPSPRGWVQVMGQTQSSSIGDQEFRFDLPDEDFFYPGDVLRYYISAEAADGSLSTLPLDIGAFQGGVGYDETFVVRALPTLRDPAGDHPPILHLDYSAQGSLSPYRHDLSQIGLQEGVHYDTFAPRFLGPGAGIGAAWAHGALADLIDGYSCILLTAGARGEMQDLDPYTLEPWHDAPGDRFMFHFGDRYAASTQIDLNYSEDHLGFAWTPDPVYPAVGSRLAPVVVPQVPAFDTSFVIDAECGGEDRFDVLTPLAAATLGHAFPVEGGGGAIYPNVAGSVLWDRMIGGFRKVDVTFPFDLAAVRDGPGAGTDSRSARARLLEDLLVDLAGHTVGSPTAVSPIVSSVVAELRVVPNPFNPATTISFSLASEGYCTVEVYDLRGIRVGTVVDEVLRAGRHERTWAATDDRGFALASGVYFAVLRAGGQKTAHKLVLLK